MSDKHESKTRAVSFRVSRSQYEELVKLTEESGVENVSEFLRIQLTLVLSDKMGKHTVREELDRIMHSVLRDMRQIAQLVDR